MKRLNRTSITNRLIDWGHAQRSWRARSARNLRAKFPPVLLPSPSLNQAWPHLGSRCPRSARLPLNAARWWMARVGWDFTPWGFYYRRRVGGLWGMWVAAWAVSAALVAVPAAMIALLGLAFIWAPVTVAGALIRAVLAWCGWIRYTPIPSSSIPDAVPASWTTQVQLPELDEDDPWSWNERHDPVVAMQREGLRLQALAVEEIRRANDLAERPQVDTAAASVEPQGVPVSGKALIPAALAVAAAAVVLVLAAYHGAPDPGSWDTIHATAEAQP